MGSLFPPSALRVKVSTSHKANEKLEKELLDNVSKSIHAGKEDISKRIEQLNKEWDTERVLEANASAIIVIGTILGFLVSDWYFLLCGFIAFFLLIHALMGWCPPLPLIRKLGVRTVYEICTEKMILKHLRGDFDEISHNANQLVKAANTESIQNS